MSDNSVKLLEKRRQKWNGIPKYTPRPLTRLHAKEKQSTHVCVQKLTFPFLLPGITTTTDNAEVVRLSKMVVLAVKPHILPHVLKDIRNVVTKDHVIVSIAAGAFSFLKKYGHGTLLHV